MLGAADEDRCSKCTQYRQVLSVLNCRQEKENTSAQRTDPSSHVNYRFLNTPEKIVRLQQLHHKNRLVEKKLSRLEEKLKVAIDQQAHVVDHETTNDLCTIVAEEDDRMTSKLPKDSFQRVFWEQQKQAASKADKRGIRWHPLFIRWCLYLRHQSSKAYDTLRQSDCIALPSQRTLRDYSHAVKAEVGFSMEVDHQLMTAAKVMTCEEWERLVVILMDEMYIKEDLVYEKHSGTLIGFANLGQVSNQLLAFEQSLEQDSSPSSVLAKSVMTFMVKGLFSPLKYPYAHFLCSSVTGDLLFNPFWEAVFRLERMGLKVRYLQVCR